MDKKEFIEKLKDIMQTDSEIDENTELETIEEWDSIAKISLISFMDSEFKISLNGADIEEFKTVSDILKKVGV